MSLADGSRYKARAVEWSQFTPHEKTGNEEIRVLLEITEGESKGVTRTWRGYATEETAERTIESLRIMGWTGDDITDVQGLNANEVSIVIKHEEWEGKIQEKIAWINRVNSVYQGKPMDEARKQAFSKRMKGLVLASKQGERSSPNPPAKASADSFPFGENAPKRAGGVKL